VQGAKSNPNLRLSLGRRDNVCPSLSYPQESLSYSLRIEIRDKIQGRTCATMKLQGSEEREALEGRNSIVDKPGRAGRFRDTLSNFSLEDKIRLVGFTNDTTRMLRNAAMLGPSHPTQMHSVRR
jgi:hypothetical protein